MKREFLQNFKIGDTPLPKEIIDAIMAENGNDIEAAKKPFADYDTIKTQLSEAQKTIKGFEDQDIEGVRKSAKDWEDKYNKAIEDHKAEMDNLAFDGELDAGIKKFNGKNAKAIKALLDVETLKASKNRASDIDAAIEALTKAEDSGFLFGAEQKVPPYAGGTGKDPVTGKYDADTAKIMRAAGLDPEKD